MSAMSASTSHSWSASLVLEVNLPRRCSWGPFSTRRRTSTLAIVGVSPSASSPVVYCTRRVCVKSDSHHWGFIDPHLVGVINDRTLSPVMFASSASRFADLVSLLAAALFTLMWRSPRYGYMYRGRFAGKLYPCLPSSSLAWSLADVVGVCLYIYIHTQYTYHAPTYQHKIHIHTYMCTSMLGTPGCHCRRCSSSTTARRPLLGGFVVL